MPTVIKRNGVETLLYTPEEVAAATEQQKKEAQVFAAPLKPLHGRGQDTRDKPVYTGPKGGRMTYRQKEAAAEEAASLTRGAARIPLTFAEGAGQLATAAGEAVGVPGADTEEYNTAVDAQRSEGALRMPSTPAGRFTTEMGAALVGTPSLKAATWLGAIGKGGASAALGSATLYDPEAQSLLEKYPEAAIAGGIGLVLGGATAPLAILNTARRGVERGVESNPYASILAKRAEKLGVNLSLGQYTGIPYIQALERQAFTSRAAKFIGDQNRELLTKYVTQMRPALDNALNVGMPKSVAQSILGEIDDAGTKGWRSAQLEAEMLAGGSPNKISNSAFGREFNEILGERFNFVGNLAKNDPASEIGGYMRDLRALADEPGWSIRDTSDALRGIEQLDDAMSRMVKRGQLDPAQQERIYAKLLKGAHEDIATTRASAGSVPFSRSLAPALDLLEESRNAYRINRATLRATESDAVHRLLGAGGPEDAGQLLDNFAGMSPRDQGQIRAFLDEHGMDTLAGMQNEAINRAAIAARGNEAAGQAPINLDAFEKALFGPKGPPAALWTKQQLNHIEEVRDALRVFKTAPQGGGAAQVGAGEVAPVLVSRSPIFAARVVARALQGTKAGNMFFDPKVYKPLLEASKLSGPVADAIRAGVVMYIHETYGEDEQPEQ